uniref:NADH dehydrogenase subunit 6 n=1 Tax=Dermacentor reticulatus TaxID=57047 RepID=A0A6M9ZZU2_DERRT|nr:NADH dehydrogenase subunit 6 [Dermacentor reticulatus]UZG91622.1 NADH dehydrogenase subunit 6 [Dermacentor reticulatus]UZG91687.1 NADH dehydrogenase subunit 6 [Dermacentor reticulatus]UZG91713.1 NADH dehydrogenase subunit 6 [Dermacentor reticulatus]UZG91726.1 NADH dehydrogenase subunit 6 [Dermacentor reticulatus]
MKLLILLSILCMSMSHPIMMLMSLILLTLFLSMSFYFLFQFSLVSLLMILIILGGMLIIFMYMISLCPNKKIFINIKMIIFSILMTIPIYFPFHMMSFNIINIEKIYSINFTNMLILMMLFLIMSLMIISKNLNWINCPIKKYI